MCKVSSNVTGSNFYFRKVVTWLVSCFFASIIFIRKTSVDYFWMTLQRKTNTMREGKSYIFMPLPLLDPTPKWSDTRSALVIRYLKDGEFLNAYVSMSTTWEHLGTLLKTYQTHQQENHGNEGMSYRSSYHFAKNVVRPGYVWWRFTHDWIQLIIFCFA